MFSVFSRLHRRDEIEGAGLGLSICRRIMDLYGGTIWCDESDMGGASFCIKAPKAESMHDKS
ncbi:MAG: ATP-binding protein [Pseudomonadota bacterium]